MRLIDEEVLAGIIYNKWINKEITSTKYNTFLALLDEVPTTEIVRCRDCIFYTKPHIEFRDGTKKFFDSENDIECVTSDVGVNVGGMCVGHKVLCTAHDREDPEDNEEIVVFRLTSDFCSYGRCGAKMDKEKKDESVDCDG